ncbi:efflux RND transporter periplasmic adaptor subunit [Alkalihalobacillus macyae]|uniref:efflux RND transporter periplasmic adaptor subunit n=1 Tax=Guptibacillus hwajinpoensis TaxID=208199 RepID=UPI00273B03F0|nr:efflux RND transporter periplasmic adaptor subunit [Alkalihalobacillus macyae]MDP4550726.1 efflux RND transporter periplasmic adaptor subunit [Alkalihalobacillus macyae]
MNKLEGHTVNRKSLWISISAALFLLLFITANTLLIQRVLADEKKVETVTVKGKTYQELVSFDGVLIPELEESYYYQSSRGEISDVLVKEGDEVTSGTTLFEYEEVETVNVSELEAQLNKAETAVSVLDDQLNDLSLQSSRVESNTDLEDEQKLQLQLDVEEQVRDTEYKKRLAELDVKELERQIQEAGTEEIENTVDSSLDGLVKEINRTPEDGEPVVTVLSNKLAVQGSVSELDYPTLKADQEVTVHAPAYPGQPVTGRITMIENRPYQVDEESGLSFYHFTVEMEGENEIASGTHVTIDAPLHQNKNAPSVPEESIIQKGSVSYVVVLEDTNLYLRVVEQGRIEDGKVEILSGLQLKEKVLTKPKEAFTELLSEKKEKQDKGNKDEEDKEEPSKG